MANPRACHGGTWRAMLAGRLDWLRLRLSALRAACHSRTDLVLENLWEGKTGHHQMARADCGAMRGGRRGHGGPDVARRTARRPPGRATTRRPLGPETVQTLDRGACAAACSAVHQPGRPASAAPPGATDDRLCHVDQVLPPHGTWPSRRTPRPPWCGGSSSRPPPGASDRSTSSATETASMGATSVPGQRPSAARPSRPRCGRPGQTPSPSASSAPSGANASTTSSRSTSDTCGRLWMGTSTTTTPRGRTGHCSWTRRGRGPARAPGLPMQSGRGPSSAGCATCTSLPPEAADVLPSHRGQAAGAGVARVTR
jgi:hypothetical protein